jgi:hypothetical protein
MLLIPPNHFTNVLPISVPHVCQVNELENRRRMDEETQPFLYQYLKKLPVTL